ncbi:hypothetical protein HPB48_019905 [Haemaphysalis longicornis]|uniref:Uncharacterized protein n=1 Tax=Haemaphysalis longicornis TaxID=44386 RepID=A0A9J6FSJ3_HAELO|nr:hypothetical protein HPB48_019905 [Haemaphysalis longicornis]
MDLYNRYTNTINNTAYNAFVICGSTGKAALAMGGTTVHAASELSRKTTGPNNNGGLSASELNAFRVAFRNVKCVIIDEALVLFKTWLGEYICDDELVLQAYQLQRGDSDSRVEYVSVIARKWVDLQVPDKI